MVNESLLMAHLQTFAKTQDFKNVNVLAETKVMHHRMNY